MTYTDRQGKVWRMERRPGGQVLLSSDVGIRFTNERELANPAFDGLVKVGNAWVRA